QMAKIVRHTSIPPQQIKMPKRRFSHVHIDIVGPLKPSNHHRYLLTIIGRFTRWSEVIPLQNIEAATVAQKLVEHWISRFGLYPFLSVPQSSALQWTIKLWLIFLKFALVCEKHVFKV